MYCYIVCLCVCVCLQVKWSGSPVEYSLEGEFPEMLFTINREGIIYLNAPLDRETQDQVKDKKNLFHTFIVLNLQNSVWMLWKEKLKCTIVKLLCNFVVLLI